MPLRQADLLVAARRRIAHAGENYRGTCQGSKKSIAYSVLLLAYVGQAKDLLVDEHSTR